MSRFLVICYACEHVTLRCRIESRITRQCPSGPLTASAYQVRWIPLAVSPRWRPCATLYMCLRHAAFWKIPGFVPDSSYDESRLNRSRTCVTWVSANTWGPGSIYGNAEFCFSWEHVIKDRHFYWVEAMTDYKPHAYRFLITDRDLSNPHYVTPYDPETDKGPLQLKNGVWYWNRSKTSEFMIDGDLKLKNCIAFDIVSHDATKCGIYGASCPDAAADHYRIGGRIIAFILGNGIIALIMC